MTWKPSVLCIDCEDRYAMEGTFYCPRCAAEIRKQSERDEEHKRLSQPSERTTLADGTQIYPEHRNILKEGPREGQQKDYVVLAEEERAKGFVRPVRRAYTHLKCGAVTKMAQTIAETYARNPFFYSGTFCCACKSHFPIGEDGEFVWDDGSKVGT